MTRIYTCFPKGKYKAVTFSYDDGKCMDERLIKIFNQYKLKATFHLNSNLLGKSKGHQYPYIEKAAVKEIYKGHEIASHTTTHPTLTRIPKQEMIHEVLDDRKNLEQITGKLVKGFSYPNGQYDEEVKKVLEVCDIVYARTTKNTFRFDIAEDYLEWNPTCHHKDANQLVEKFVSSTYDQRLQLFYIWGHSYEFERDNNWQMIETLAKQISFKKDIWYATNMEIYRYLKSAKELEYSSDGNYVYNPTQTSIWISVDGECKEIPGGAYICLLK